MTSFLSWLKHPRSIQLFRLPAYLRTIFIVSFLLSSIQVLLFLVYYFALQPNIPLFYSLPQPNDYLVQKAWLVVFPVSSFFITFFHFYVLRSLRHYEVVIQKVFGWVTVMLQVLLALAFVRIIYIAT